MIICEIFVSFNDFYKFKDFVVSSSMVIDGTRPLDKNIIHTHKIKKIFTHLKTLYHQKSSIRYSTKHLKTLYH